MDRVLKLLPTEQYEKLRQLTDVDGIPSDETLQEALLLIFNSCVARIYKIADALERGLLDESKCANLLVYQQIKINLPLVEEWDFNLGDAVSIKRNKYEYEWIQTNTLGWKAEYAKVYGQIGIVVQVLCKYDNSIHVYFPEKFCVCVLYTGLFEKVAFPLYPNVSTRWKSGDYVTTVHSDLLTDLQENLDPIPSVLHGCRGKVVAVTCDCVVVTFNEKTSYRFESCSLVPIQSEHPLLCREIVHHRGFVVGETVKVISNLWKLITNQANYGGYDEGLSVLRGEVARVIALLEDDSVIVQVKHRMSRRLAPQSILRVGERELDSCDEDFVVGDIVNVKVPSSFRSFLAKEEVPISFLDYLKTSAALTYMGYRDLYIRFNDDEVIQTHKENIRPASVNEKLWHSGVQNCTTQLHSNCFVYLDVGPKNFVQSVLLKSDHQQAVKKVISKCSVLTGFRDAYHAVIEYENGQRFLIHRNFVTLPGKFYVLNDREMVSLHTVFEIIDQLGLCIMATNEKQDDQSNSWSIEISRLRQGTPFFVEFSILSDVPFKSSPDLKEIEKNRGWTVEERGQDQFLIISEQNIAEVKIKVELVYKTKSNPVKPILNVLADSERNDVPAATSTT